MCRHFVEALGDAGASLPTRLLTEYAVRAKGTDRSDPAIWGPCRELVRGTLARLVIRGLVQKIVSDPEVWRGLAG
jgi:hypothetical protein